MSKYTFKKQKLACLIGGMFLVLATDALAATVTSSATSPVTGHAPSLTAGKITYADNNSNGVLDKGDEVKIDPNNLFVFSDVDGDTATAETYSWRVDGNEVGTGDTYIITDSDLGKSITLMVTPHTDPGITDPAEGTAIAAVDALKVSAADTILSVAITGGSGNAGSPVVSDTLTATPTCTKACGTINYQWQIEDASGSGKYVDITGATSNTWQVTTSTQKRKVQVVASN